MDDFNQNARTNDAVLDELYTDVGLDLIMPCDAVTTSRGTCTDPVFHNDDRSMQNAKYVPTY